MVSYSFTGHDCVSCMDPIRGVEIQTPCNHYYDKDCILALFEAATRDESLFPPRCCQRRIPVASVQPYMSPEALAQFRNRTNELRVEKRVYCAKLSCSRFLGAQYEGVLPSILAPSLKCSAPGCGTSTCSWCKNEVTAGRRHRCEENATDQSVLALGQASGWARCPGCETLIELVMGCYHMTCRCKTEFCYLCRARWKTCSCPQWDERRLVAAAEERADVQIRLERGAPFRRAHPRRRIPRLVVVNPEPPPRATEPDGDEQDDAPAAPLAGPSNRRASLRAVMERIEEDEVVIPIPDPVAEDLGALRTGGPRPTTPIPTEMSEVWRAVDEAATVAGALETDTFLNATRASLVFTDIDSRVAPSTEASVAPLHWHKQSQEERERRHALTMRWVEQLRQDHGCAHNKWTFHRGEGICALCEEHIPVCYFVSLSRFGSDGLADVDTQRCNVCDIRICRRCRWNRT